MPGKVAAPPPVPEAALPFLVILAGVAHALLQEQLMVAMPAKLPLLITMFEFGVCSGHSGAWLAIFGKGGVSTPKLPLLRISLLVFASLVCGNIALRWVSYPVKVIVKSCKVFFLSLTPFFPYVTPHSSHITPFNFSRSQTRQLLPTMLLGSALLGKRYAPTDHIAAALLCLGLVGFTLAPHGDSAAGSGSSAVLYSSNPLGVGLLFFAVCCDAVQVLSQEKLMRANPKLTPMHVMLWSNGMAFVAVASGFFLTGEFAVFRRVPAQGVPILMLYAYGFSSWVGVCCFIALTRSWGGTAAVVTTNSRKLLTIVFSFIFFPKPLGSALFLSGLVVMAGIGLHAYNKVYRLDVAHVTHTTPKDNRPIKPAADAKTSRSPKSARPQPKSPRVAAAASKSPKRPRAASSDADATPGRRKSPRRSPRRTPKAKAS